MKRQILLVLVAATLAALGSGCATTQDLDRVERKVGTVNSEVASLRTSLDEANALLREDVEANRQTLEKVGRMSSDLEAMRQDIDVVKRNQAGLGSAVSSMAGGELMSYGGQIDELRHELENTKLKLDAFKAALLQKLADIEGAIGGLATAASRPEALGSRSITGGDGESPSGEGMQAGGGAAATQPPPVADPLQLYQSAYLDYTKGNYELAMMGFKDYLAAFPDGEFSGNAQYWIGESLYSLGYYKEALIEFEKVLSDYPESPKAAGAMLKEGLCFDRLGQADKARQTYKELIDKHPLSDAAKIAEGKLNPKRRGQVEGR